MIARSAVPMSVFVAIAMPAVVPIPVAVPVSAPVAVALGGPFASVMVSVFALASVSFFLGTLSLGLFSGQRFLEFVKAAHFGIRAARELKACAMEVPIGCQESDVEMGAVTSFPQAHQMWNVRSGMDPQNNRSHRGPTVVESSLLTLQFVQPSMDAMSPN